MPENCKNEGHLVKVGQWESDLDLRRQYQFSEPFVADSRYRTVYIILVYVRHLRLRVIDLWEDGTMVFENVEFWGPTIEVDLSVATEHCSTAMSLQW